jgi:flagellar motor protein MotB
MMWIAMGLAWATDGVDAGGLHTATLDADPRDPLFVERPGAMGSEETFGTVTLQGALHDGALVDGLGGLTLGAGGTFHPRFRIDAALPLAVVDDGVGSFGPLLGDLRVRTLATLVAPEAVVRGGGGPGLGLVTWVDLPSGAAWAQLGSGRPAPGAKLAATWEGSWFTATIDGGAQALPSVETLDEGGLTVLAGGAFGVLLRERVGLHLEGTLRQPSRGPTGVQLALSGRVERGFAGVTLGIPASTGVPVARLMIGATFAGRNERLRDIDSVGELTIQDRCPLERETVNGYKDDDGCPDTLAALSVDVRWRGASMPARVVLREGEREETVAVGSEGHLVDAVPGRVWSAEATAECLRGASSTVAREEGAVLTVELQPDRPRSITLEVVDETGAAIDAEAFFATTAAPACVPGGVVPVRGGRATVGVGPGAHTVTVTSGSGSAAATIGADDTVRITLQPDAVRLRDGLLETRDAIAFDGDRIATQSFAVLDEVAAWLLTHDGTATIGSHTDNTASEPVQLRLSRARADAVRRYLIGKGVPPPRLSAIGYGPTRPIDTNRTAAGRARNDRITFAFEESP